MLREKDKPLSFYQYAIRQDTGNTLTETNRRSSGFFIHKRAFG
jgi:hypothetical protein